LLQKVGIEPIGHQFSTLVKIDLLQHFADTYEQVEHQKIIDDHSVTSDEYEKKYPFSFDFNWTKVFQFQNCDLPGRLALQTCPADLPGRLARQTCPADLLGILAWQTNNEQMQLCGLEFRLLILCYT
jgi:hypothetical protein